MNVHLEEGGQKDTTWTDFVKYVFIAEICTDNTCLYVIFSFHHTLDPDQITCPLPLRLKSVILYRMDGRQLQYNANHVNEVMFMMSHLLYI